MELIKELDKIEFDILSNKFKGIIQPLTILKWLNNFKKKDINKAIKVLKTLNVYNTDDIETILNYSFEELLNSSSSKKIKFYVIPLGDFGKSGSMISYFFQKTSVYKNNRNRFILKSYIEIDEINDDVKSLVIIDDFIGTGTSFNTFYDEKVESHKGSFREIFFIGIAAMEFGLKNIQDKVDKVLIQKSNIFKKAFSYHASYFSYRKQKPYREFCYKYGKALLTHSNALGYENSQSLISFSYGSPNNTLPIFWANKNGWQPLIPRFSKDKISRSKLIRKNILFELSILREFGSENIKKELFSIKIKKNRKFSSISKLDFSLYSIIHLSRKNYSEARICQILGILSSDFKQIVQEGKRKNIFNKKEELTTVGLNLYYEAKKTIDRYHNRLQMYNEGAYEVKKVDYKPKTFNGNSY